MSKSNSEKATARPWKVECLSPRNVWINSVDDRGPMPVARTLNGDNDVYDAELIVKAVNSHDALLEACKDLLAISVRSGLDNGKNTDSDICNNARKAITQAESK